MDIAILAFYVIVYGSINFGKTGSNTILIGGFRIEERRTLKSRSEIPDLLVKSGYKTMIEIGVRDAAYALDFLQNWPGFEHYYDIDP